LLDGKVGVRCGIGVSTEYGEHTEMMVAVCRVNIG
jgi:hypothetical protein